MDGLIEVRDKLRVDATVVSLVGAYQGKSAIYGRPVAPGKFTGTCVTMYISAPTDGGLEFGNYGITVNCFADKYLDCQKLQDAVFKALNRKSDGEDTFFRCSKLPIIPAANTGDDYNAPVEVLVRQR